ncbi:MAG: flagellar basal body P-ring formation protein FlgA [Nitrospinae bacterium]|nr:flagellar basal body P-ring formation protein FlgA [Nitrospinota bacterium]
MDVKSLTVAVVCALLALGVAEAVVKPDPANFAAVVKSAVREKLDAELSKPGRVLESVDVAMPEKLKQEDFESMDVVLQSLSPSGDRAFVTVLFKKNGKLASRLNLSAALKISVDTFVAARDLKRGMDITANDVRAERAPAGPWFEKYAVNLEDLVGKQMDRNIKEGTPIRLDQVSRPKMVNSGDSVTIVAQKGSLKISASGKARQDGELGEWIKVSNADSSKILTAKVTGPGEVSVEF